MVDAVLYHHCENNKIQCNFCAHYCKLSENQTGFCGVRQNIHNKIELINYGIVRGLAIDPIEKKPFYHYYPGSSVLSFGLDGCNFTCLNCQNYHLSQTIKITKSISEDNFTPANQIVDMALQTNVLGIAYTYSEPTIFFDYVLDVINCCKGRGDASHLKHLLVSNGYFSKELINLIIDNQIIDAVNIDLKFMDEINYRKICNGKLQVVLDNIALLAASRIHLEIINLIIPGLNDSDDDLRSISKFIAGIDRNIPLHFSRFHPAYNMTDRPATPVKTLENACHIAKSEGNNHVYIGNVQTKHSNNTYCHSCGELIVSRNQFTIVSTNLRESSDQWLCGKCGASNNFPK